MIRSQTEEVKASLQNVVLHVSFPRSAPDLAPQKITIFWYSSSSQAVFMARHPLQLFRHVPFDMIYLNMQNRIGKIEYIYISPSLPLMIDFPFGTCAPQIGTVRGKDCMSVYLLSILLPHPIQIKSDGPGTTSSKWIKSSFSRSFVRTRCNGRKTSIWIQVRLILQQSYASIVHNPTS